MRRSFKWWVLPVLFALIAGCTDGYVGGESNPLTDASTDADPIDASDAASDADTNDTAGEDARGDVSDATDTTADSRAPDVERSVSSNSWEVTVDDVTRDVYAVVPDPIPDRPTAWVFLHGCTQDGEDLAESIAAEQLARDSGVVALFPSQELTINPQGCWRWYSENERQPTDSEVAFMAETVDAAADRLEFDPGRRYLTGFSAGGGLAANTAGCRPAAFDGIVVHSGTEFAAADSALSAATVLTSPSQARDPDDAGQLAFECGDPGTTDVPMLIIHGLDDTTVDPDHAERTARQVLQTRDLRDNGTDDDSISWTDADSTDRQLSGRNVTIRNFDGTPLRLMTIEGLDHAYSGATGLYGDPDAPNATDYSRQFFQD